MGKGDLYARRFLTMLLQNINNHMKFKFLKFKRKKVLTFPTEIIVHV